MKKTYRNWPKRAILLISFAVLSFFIYTQKEAILSLLKLNQYVNSKSESDPTFYSEIGTTPRMTNTSRHSETNVVKKYTVEILVTKSKKTAEDTIKKLAKKNIDAFYIPLQNGPEVIYRVRVGLFQSKKQAEKVANNINKKSGLNTTIKIFL